MVDGSGRRIFMSKWEYTFHISSVNSVGISEIPSVDDLWDDNGYHIREGSTKTKSKHETENDVINSYGQKGWELVSITPISFLINRNEMGQTSDLMLTFKKPVE
jgi:hypothetical protein